MPAEWLRRLARVVSRQTLRRWAAVAAGTAILCALPALVAAVPVPASPLTAAQLRSRILASARVPYQGYAESTVSLDLPDLPYISDVTSLLDGSTDQYTWYRSPDQWRSAVLTTAGETDVYQAPGRGTFQWSYADDLLTQIVGSEPVRLPRAADLLPPPLALRLLSFAGPGDRAVRLPSQRIAGIDAAGLRLAPAGQDTTVASVEIWADPANGLPVQVLVFGRGSSAPVLVSRFLDVSLAEPPAAEVAPALNPAGRFSTAEEPDIEGIVNGYGPSLPARLGGVRRSASPSGLPDVAAYGTGFARFAVLPLPQRTGAAMVSAASSAGASITLGTGTAELITTPLLTVLLTRSASGQTFLLAGAVTPAVLVRAATRLADLP